MLKADVHRGEGLRFAPARVATAEALRPSADGGKSWALAQRFVAPQLLIDETPFYIRCAAGRNHVPSHRGTVMPEGEVAEPALPCCDRRDCGCDRPGISNAQAVFTQCAQHIQV